MRDNDIEECQKCLFHIVEQAKDIAPDLVVVAGDIFDNRNVKLDSESARLCFDVFSDLASISPVAVLIGTPSHDGLAAEVLSHVGAEYPIRVSSRPEQFHLIEGVFQEAPNTFHSSTCIVTMVPTPTKQFWSSNSDIKGTDAEIGQAMGSVFAGFGAASDKFPETPHILVGHFSIGGAQLSENQYMIGRDIEISRDQLALAKADVICLGHIHKAQAINPNIFYCGSLYRKDYGEMDPKGFYVHEIIPGKTVVSDWTDTPSRYLYRISRDLTRQENPDFLITPTAVEAKELINSQLRIELRIWQDEADKIDQAELSDRFLAIGAQDVQIRLARVPRAQVRSESMLTLASLREKLVERARLGGETVLESILIKADLLESESAEAIFNNLKGGAA